MSGDSITPDTKMVLAGALYFDAKWHHDFKPRLTENETFHLIDGKTVSVPMMNNKFAANYVEVENYQALELPYKMFDYSMIIVLPKEGSFKKIESSMTPDFLKSVITSLKPKLVTVKLPKFKYTSPTVSLNNILMSMGMKDAFTPSADFSGIYESENPFVSQVIHKAFVDVNEYGTTAGAITVVQMVGGGGYDLKIEFFCDRPFIYLIYNKKIETILFIGRMMNPKE
jgi:serpin B